MDLNFAELKKEAAATGEDLFNVGAAAAKETAAKLSHDLLGKDNNHDNNDDDDDKAAELDFEHVDPQTFVQRMSAGAKEAQEELDAKFAKSAAATKDDFDDLLGSAAKDFTSGFQQFQQDVKKDIGGLTNDFMQAERGFMGGAFGAGDQPKPPVAVATPSSAQVAVDDLLGGPLESVPPFAPSAPVSHNFDDSDDDIMLASPRDAPNAAKDLSDTDTPSVSCNPSPAKKNPITDALKEQDNEKFISSEDLLSDFKEDAAAQPSISVTATTTAASGVGKVAAVPTTDLDANSDFDDEEFADVKKPELHSQVEELVKQPAPAVPVATKIETPAAPAVAKEPVAPAVVKDTKPAVIKESPQPKQTSPTQVPQPKIVSVEEIFYKYGLDAWFKPERLHPRVESLIYWRDVKKSGIVFGAGLLILLAVSCCSVISVFAYTSLITLAVTVAFRIYKSIMQAIQKTPEGHPFKEYLDIDLTLSQEKVQNIAGIAVAHLNGFTAELRRLFLVDDLVDSIKFGVILWVLTYIGAWFNGMTLVILAFVALFTLPKIYENNKQSIDTYLDLVRSKLTEITDKIKVAIPIGKKPVAAETEKDK